MAVLTGRQGNVLTDGAQPKQRALKQTTGPINDVGYYIQPNALSGILIVLFMLFFLIMGILQLMAVQTPYVFVSESIDFGKIEK